MGETTTAAESAFDQCFEGPYCPFRDHDTEFGWGIRHRPTGRVFGYIGDKMTAFGVAAALNHKWDAAQVFLNETLGIEDAYFEARFKRG